MAVVANIVADLEKRGYALTVGEVCLPYLLRALGDAGRSDVLFAMTVQSEYPGYAYQLKQGATALCETWNAYPDNAQSQFMLGHVMEWFYRDVAGIRLDPASPGFGHVIIQPTIVGDLTEARASYDSVRGKIVSEWKRDGPRLTLHVIIPPNVTATIVMPTRAPGSVTESGKAISTAAGITGAEAGEAHAAFSIGSGDYTFGALLP
jgi:alpha-L-rhamnosidase